MAYIEYARQYLSVLYLVNLIVYSSGEVFFRDRWHRDQELYESAMKPFVITREREAEEMLVKYGFVKCKSRRKREANVDFIHEKITDQYLSNYCDPSELKKAVVEYQKEYNLPVTGKLGQREFDHMSQSRCGNVDMGSELVENHKTLGTDKQQSSKIRRKRNVVPKLIRLAEAYSQVKGDRLAKDVTGNIGTNSDLSRSRLWHKQYKPMDSMLIKILTPKPIHTAMDRRRKYLSEYGKRLSTYMPFEMSELRRRKRSPVFNSKLKPSQMFAKGTVRWRVLDSGFSTRISSSEQVDVLELAFRIWSEIIPIVFIHDEKSHIENIDIEVAFGKKEHADCMHAFDGNGGEIAHSWHGGNMHFDDDERYRTYESNSLSKEGIYLLRVAVHEIGHVLGLQHSTSRTSMMYSIYNKKSNEHFELGDIDRMNIVKIYGPCRGKFNLVMDWVRLLPDKKRVFNTYFFRKTHYWMYDNKNRRTRYGDPLMIAPEWKGIPDDMDAYVHIWYKISKVSHVSLPYFFKDDKVYLFNNAKNRIEDQWPRKISEVFNSTDCVPDNIDTCMFDYRDKNVYFFKNEWVYVYDPKVTGNDTGNCVRKGKISDEFPTAEGHKPLPNQIDVAYFSFKNHTVFFFRGNEVWQNVLFSMKQRQHRNLIHYKGNWSNYWHYICDTV